MKFFIPIALLLLAVACTTVDNDPPVPARDGVNATADAESPSTTDDGVGSGAQEAGDGTGADDGVQTFTLTARNFRFSMDGEEAPELRVKEGDRVRIELVNEEGFHDWVLDEFDAATEQVPAGETTSVEFVAGEKGTYEYYCSVGEHRQMGMVGDLVVE